MGRLGLLFAVSAALAPSSLLAGAVPHESYYPPATEPSLSKKFTDKLGAVASEAEICSTIGIDLLRKGGSAADAMVGTVFCVGTVGEKTRRHFKRSQVKLTWCRHVSLGNRRRWLHARAQRA